MRTLKTILRCFLFLRLPLFARAAIIHFLPSKESGRGRGWGESLNGIGAELVMKSFAFASTRSFMWHAHVQSNRIASADTDGMRAAQINIRMRKKRPENKRKSIHCCAWKNGSLPWLSCVSSSTNIHHFVGFLVLVPDRLTCLPFVPFVSAVAALIPTISACFSGLNAN